MLRIEQARYVVGVPFCEWSEVWYYRDLLSRIWGKVSGLPRKSPVIMATIYERDFTPVGKGNVVWKGKNFNEQTGLVISGPISGYLVYHGDKPRIGRPISVDGSAFDPQRAQDSPLFNNLPVDLQHMLRDRMAEATLVLPNVLVTLMQYMDYPVDKGRFIGNIEWENFVYRP